MGKGAKWTAIILSIAWLFASLRWGRDLNWEGRDLWLILFIAGLVPIWLAAGYLDSRSGGLMDNFASMGKWVPAFLLVALLLAWGSWILRYESHITPKDPAIWIFDRWTGCATLYAFTRDDVKEFSTCRENT